MSNNIKNLDFTGGIRADDIQYNFDTLNKQLKWERSRTGGYGIVEGFHVEALSGKDIKISEGIIVNKSGEEVIIQEKMITLKDPDFAEHKLTTREDAITVNEDGEFQLPYIPYSDKRKGHFDTNYYQNNYPEVNEELSIRSVKNSDLIIRAIRIEGRLITIDANAWANEQVFVEYLHTKNRMDTILINEAGDIKIEKGVLSTSPSHVNLDRYDDFFVLAIVEVIVGTKVSLKVYEDHRTYRKIYVDQNNNLYINGKLYKESQIVHFTEPEPYENALWYDQEINKLMIWKDTDGVYGWVNINEETHMPVRKIKIFSPEEFPEDGQTFIFNEEEIDMKFIPGHNQVEVIIDNSPLMSDQFTEVIDPDTREYVNAGIGLKLKDPLDRPTHVEVRIMHSVHANPLRRTFQRTATFTNESFIYHSELNEDNIYTTEVPYVAGEKQLEVHLDGIKLERGLQFQEVLGDGSSIVPGDMSKTFKLLTDINPGQKVSYKITRNVYSFDHLDGWVDEVEEKANQALEELKETNEGIETMDENIQLKFKDVNRNIVEIANQVGSQDDFIKKSDEISMDNMPEEVLNNIFKKGFSLTESAESITILDNLSEEDFILVFYLDEKGSRILIRDIDYVLQASDDNQLMVVLNSDLVDSNNSIYITGASFGV